MNHEKMIQNIKRLTKVHKDFAENAYGAIENYPIGVQKRVGALEQAIETLERERWVKCSETLPEERINPLTSDYYEYPCIFRSGEITDVRSYKFGEGHWWHGGGLMDDYVVAWYQIPQYEEVS